MSEKGLSELDSARARPVLLVNQALARGFLADREPIGAHLLVDDNDAGPRPLEVVGVVGDVRQLSLDGEPTFDLYLPYDQLHPDGVSLARTGMHWVVRGRLDSAATRQEARQALRSADPAVPVPDVRPLEQQVSGALAPRRFNMRVLAVFAAAALLLAATGIYAMLSYSVSQRADEFAIRSAVGARRSDLLLLVVRQGMAPALLGIALGVGAAFAITRTLSGLLFGLSATDPATFATVPAGLLAVSLAACVVPGLRASRMGSSTRASQ